ncbi:MAG: GPW/gp25 family protein [Ferruginibacter sp.]
MQFEYYSLPLCLENLILKNSELDKKDPETYGFQPEAGKNEKVRKQLAKCSLQQSVIQHVHLLLTTAFGEFPADENFGCGIWEHDFDAVSSAHKVKEAIRQSLLQSIQDKEKRLSNARVELTIVQEEQSEFGGIKSIKKKIDVLVSGTLQVTNERFQFRDTFCVGPLSY